MDARKQSRRDERVSTEGEEIVFDADPIESKDCTPDLGDDPLAIVLCFDKILLDVRTCVLRETSGVVLRGGLSALARVGRRRRCASGFDDRGPVARDDRDLRQRRPQCAIERLDAFARAHAVR